MRIATFNVNGVNGRLSVRLRWMEEANPDAVCLQELKSPQERFPEAELAAAGYSAVWLGQKSWNGVAILARGDRPIEVPRGLPGEPDDAQSRYLEAAVQGVLIASLYAPNGNPAPGPKFDYKLRWFARLAERAKYLLASEAPAMLVGDIDAFEFALATLRGGAPDLARLRPFFEFAASNAFRRPHSATNADPRAPDRRGQINPDTFMIVAVEWDCKGYFYAREVNHFIREGPK